MKRVFTWCLSACAIVGAGLLLGMWGSRSASRALEEAPSPEPTLAVTPQPQEPAFTRHGQPVPRPTPASPRGRSPSTNLPPLPLTALREEAIVTLKPGVSIQDLAAQLDAQVVGSIDERNSHRLRFRDATTAAAARAQLAADSRVEGVDLNYAIDQPPAGEALAYSQDSSAALKVTPGDSGGKIVIGLIDTAVQPASTPVADFLLPSLSVTGDYAPGSTTLTHGTSMAETLVQGLSMLPGGDGSSTVRILPVDVYGDSATTTTYQLAQGVLKAIENGATVINMSLASEGNSTLLQQIIQDAHSQGIVFLGAAGNEPTTLANYPAAYPDVIAVTATDQSGNLASYANRGSFVDIATPGTVIVDFNGLAYLVNGTSASTALASGIVARLIEQKGLTTAQAEATVRQGLTLQGQP